jgi:hypothetical protein
MGTPITNDLFAAGDLVKHKSRITWRDQRVRGIVTKVDYEFGHVPVLTIVWSKVVIDGTVERYYANSIELVARKSKCLK